MNDNEKIRYNNFIEKLYNSPSSTPQDKERIVKLLLSEREQGFMTEERVRELIKEFVSITPQIGNEKEFYHNPRNMVKFLYQFSVNDIFKWFTHAPDPNMEFDYSTYLSTAESEYNKYAKSANRATWGNVRNFIFNTSIAPKDSFNKKIDFSWRDLKEWCLNNRNIHPYNSIVGDYRFARYIETFKNTIEFRTDKAEYLFSNRLEDFIYDYMLNQSDIKIKFDDSFYSIGSHVRAYIDVRQLFISLKKIGEWIIENKDKGKDVIFSLIETSDYFTFSIFHLGSYLNLDNTKLEGLSGDFHTVRNTLLNVTDWTIESDTATIGVINIKCLCNKTQNKGDKVCTSNIIEHIPQKVGGVKHLLTFYKNIQ